MAIFTRLVPTLLLLPLPALAELPAEASAHLQTLLQSQMASAGLEQARASVQLLPPRGAWPTCAAPWQFEADVRNPGRISVEARCPAGGSIQLIARAQLTARVAVAARAVPAGTALAPEDVQWEARPLWQPEDMVGTNTPWQGLTSRAALKAGQPLRRKALIAPQQVKRGGEVNIVARSEGVEASAPGEALENGAAGDIVRVKNLRSGKVLRARVSGPGEVAPL